MVKIKILKFHTVYKGFIVGSMDYQTASLQPHWTATISLNGTRIRNRSTTKCSYLEEYTSWQVLHLKHNFVFAYTVFSNILLAV